MSSVVLRATSRTSTARASLSSGSTLLASLRSATGAVAAARLSILELLASLHVDHPRAVVRPPTYRVTEALVDRETEAGRRRVVDGF